MLIINSHSFASVARATAAMLSVILLSGCGIVTEGCTLPIDIEVGGSCLVGSLGGSVLLSLGLTFGLMFLALIWSYIKALFTQK